MTGADIKAARDRLRETQEEFAKRFGVARTTLLNWEAEGPPTKGPARHHIERVMSELPQQAAE